MSLPPDRRSLLWSIIHYSEWYRILVKYRQNGESAREQGRIKAKLHRIRRARFGNDGGHHLADIIRARVTREENSD